MSDYRLQVERLRSAAAAQGDHSSYAISKRTGVAQSTLSRLRRGIAQPATATLLVLAAAYGVSVDELIERENDDAPGVEPGAPVEPVSTSTSQ
ncbi:helix-turn-helix domain-containing protein [Streptomyces sp. NBC_01723]|uniref:helix-turn-helix domain-containing protein n=1 Tax=Streptomyces sp. NBC_01723 TaxID=2975921 RepID=UPI002E334A3F|nr:helix-turn-helix transcriptional regulator [Streptomyces sp. NBC_01723]